MSKFDDFFDGVKDGLTPLVGDFVGGLKKDALDDMKAFLEGQAVQLKDWTSSLAKSEMSKDEFETLVRGSASLLKLRSLRVAGVQLARLQRLRNAVIDLVLNRAISTFLPGAAPSGGS